jgi:3-hydroxybutyryl-CoA dehydrogenase
VLGGGRMGSQIACEYALGGHRVELLSRSPEAATERVERTLELAVELGLFPSGKVAVARGGIAVDRPDRVGAEHELVVESLPEDLDLKVDALHRAAAASPGAILASNTSSLSISRLGAAAGAPDRTLGTHYWNPPLLSPLVEVVAGERTDPQVVERVRATLTELGKRPILVARDVPGFVWNRLQLALLRECAWLVENGVAPPDVVDEVVREGLARRWRHVGPFQAVALGGVATWERVGANLLPELSAAVELPSLERFARGGEADLEAAADRRDRALARELLEERGS